MKQSTLASDFSVYVREYLSDSSPMHRHNYFELIYILEGRGFHIINDNQFAYGKGDLFLLTPDDAHTFVSHEKSAFCIIDFTAAFLGRYQPVRNDSTGLNHFFTQLEYIFQNAPRFKGFVDLSNEDAPFADALLRRLVAEWDKEVFFREIILQNIVFLLLNIIARHSSTKIAPQGAANPANIAYEMITYIQHNIYDSNRITIENIAARFNLSKDYAGTYFKKHTGGSIKQFILDYKLELIKTRLIHSQLTISQIAAELDFTDESHLNKAFRKKYNMTAKQYRSTKN